MANWIRENGIYQMDLEPATKIFKKAHEIVRRTGIGHEGKKLSELERAQR